MFNKKLSQTGNQRTSVKNILRGAQRRRNKALEAIRGLNSVAGIQGGIYAVK